MSVAKRLVEFHDYLKEKGYRGRNVFEVEIGKKPGYLTTAAKNDSSIGSDVLEAVASKFPELNITWLLLGKGDMIKNNPENIEPTNSIKLPKVPEISQTELSSSTAFLAIIKEQAETIKEVTSNKEKKLIENQEAIMRDIKMLFDILKNHEDIFNSILDKLKELTSQNDISQEKKVS